ncbi:hypothetical protein SDC9_196078 [bioreactor metagenome]|uniref:Uncharacterized protein n=1 Tax=bioreactor metagenome TaxID=1076179 RepID=A0A645IAV3_9ZZZZ
MKVRHCAIAQTLMKLGAVGGQMGILTGRESDAGVEVQNILAAQNCFKFFIQRPTNAAAAAILRDIDACFYGPVIGRTTFKGRRIGIADDFIVLQCDQIRVALACFANTIGKLLDRWYGVFK